MISISYPRLRVAMTSSGRPMLGICSLTLILSLLLTPQPRSTQATPLSDLSPSAPASDFANLPITFVPNVGQNDPEVRFQASGLGGMLFFTSDEIVLALPVDTEASDTQPQHAVSMMAPSPPIESMETETTQPTAVVRLQFVGANPSPPVHSIDQLPGIVNYQIGNDPSQWHTKVPTYAALRYEQLYPGIDLRYDGTGGRLKGTYLLAVGADPQRIRWQYKGARAVTVDQDGNLVVTLSAGSSAMVAPTLREEAPIAWQTINGQEIPVDVRYTVASDNTIGFAIGGYDPTHPLVIDPTLDYSTYVGNTGDDNGRSIAVDSAGEVYITGDTTSITFPSPVGDPNHGINKGGIDAFVTKLNATGKAPVYTTYLGGGNTDIGNSIAVDAQKKAYVVGSTNSTNFANANNGFKGSTDAFVAILHDTGIISSSMYLGGSRIERGHAIALDSANNMYITGETQSPFLVADPGYDKTLGGFADAFVIKLLATDGSIAYSTYLGGDSGESGNGIAVDSGGNAYVTGFTTSSTGFFTRGIIGPRFLGESDAFITKLPPNGGQPIYSAYLGGKNSDFGTSVAVDNEGYTYITGYTNSAELFPLNGPPELPGFKGNYDGFVIQINVSGTGVEYRVLLGGTDNDYIKDIAVDDEGGVYVIGSTTSNDFPHKHALLSKRNGESDTFVTKLSRGAGSVEYSTYFGGTNNDYGEGIAWSPVATGSVYIVGITASQDFPTLRGAWKSVYQKGLSDAFVSKLSLIPDEPRLYLDPPLTFIGKNQRFTVNVRVDTNKQNIDTADAYLAFDSSILDVVNVTPLNDETTWSFKQHTDPNDPDEPGSIDISVTRHVAHGSNERPFLKDAVNIATVEFLAKETTVGTTPITLTREIGDVRQSDLYRDGTRITQAGARLDHANVQILDGSILTGHIDLEKRGTEPGPRWITPLLRKLDNGDTEKGITIYDPVNERNMRFSTTTDRNGDFSIFLKGVHGGTYPIKIKSGDTLSNLRLVNLSCTETIKFGTMRVGDSNGDDMINGADVSHMVPSYELPSSNPLFRTYGDTNKDGRVDRQDMLDLKSNFLDTGELTETDANACPPPANSQTVDSNSRTPIRASLEPAIPTSTTPDRATLGLTPSEVTVIAGQIFTVSLVADLKSDIADTIDAFLNVKPNELVFVDKEGNELGDDANIQGEVELNMAALANSSCEATYNDIAGKRTAPEQHANASVTCYKSPFLPKTFTIATFRLKARSIDQPALITLLTEGTTLQHKVRETNLYNKGLPLPVAPLRTGTQVTVLKRVATIFVPVARRPAP